MPTPSRRTDSALHLAAERRFLAVQNAALLYTAVAVNWLVVLGVVYLSPHR